MRNSFLAKSTNKISQGLLPASPRLSLSLKSKAPFHDRQLQCVQHHAVMLSLF